jgi:hypothetical protein
MDDDDWVPIVFPVEIAETVSKWLDAADGTVGLCLVCGETFGEADMIPGRPGYHNCPANIVSEFAKVPGSQE